MADDKNTFQLIIEELAKAAASLADIIGDVQADPLKAVYFLRFLGWNVPVADNIATVQGGSWDILTTAYTIEQKLSSQPPEYDALPGLIQDFIAKANNLSLELALVPEQGSSVPDFITAFKAEFPTQLFDYTVMSYMLDEHPRLFHLLQLLGVFEVVYENPTTPFRCGYMRHAINWGTLASLFTDPQNAGKTAFKWGTQEFEASKLIAVLQDCFQSFDIPASQMKFSPFLEYSIGSLLKPPSNALQVPFVEREDVEAGIRIYPVPPTAIGAHDAGIAVSPYLQGTGETQVDITDTMSLEIDASLTLDRTTGAVLRPTGVTLFDLNAATAPQGMFFTKLHIKGTDKTVLLGSPQATRLEAQDVSFSVRAVTGNEQDIALEFALSGASIVIMVKDGDGFLQKILPNDPLELDFDLALGISSSKGFYISGGAGLEYTCHLNQSFGPISISTVNLKLGSDNNKLKLIAAASGSAAIGPVSAVVQEIGLQAILETGKPGIFGNADLSFGFKPPSGIGLALDAPGISGGGFLLVEDTGYAGVLQVEVQEIVSITAIAILTTRLPDGSKIFSLKILGMVEFPPIQLGLGFILTGLGFVAAINCVMCEDALRQSVYTGSLTSLLFPPDPIKNAPKIISDLKSFFPPQNDCHVFGAMVRLGWGGARALIEADMGIFLQIGGPLRIAIAGIARTALPVKEAAVIYIELQTIGIMNFQDGTLSIDSSLEKSYILCLQLDGDIALRASWKDNPRFALSAGGFYPGYRIPVGFPDLQRLSITLGSGNPRVGLFLYLATAENSVQFGALLILYYSKDLGSIGFFELDAAVGFDALFHFNPFFFDAALFAHLALKRNGDNFCGISLNVQLSGPNNYHAIGYAEFKVLGFKKKIEFNEYFGDTKPELPQPVVSPLQILIHELGRKENWEVVPPFWGSGQVTFTKDTEARLDTFGGLSVRQRAVPLKFTIAKFGAAAVPAGEDYFDLIFSDQQGEENSDSFPLGQFEYLTDDQKIAAPPFETAKSGVRISNHALSLSDPSENVIRACGVEMTYETKFQTSLDVAPLPPQSLDIAPLPPAPGRSPVKPIKKSKILKPIITSPVDHRHLVGFQALAGERHHNSTGATSFQGTFSGIMVREEKFTVATAQVRAGKLEGAIPEGPGSRPTGYSFARAQQIKTARKENDTEIVSVSKANRRQ